MRKVQGYLAFNKEKLVSDTFR